MPNLTKTKLKILDSEPRWNVESSDQQLSLLLNWYNYNKTSDDAKKYFLEFLENSGESAHIVTKIQQCSNLPLMNTVGWLCRIKTVNGEKLPTQYCKRLEDEKNKVLQIVLSIKDDVAISKDVDKKPTVQDNIQNQLSELLGELALVIDDFIANNLSTSFNMYDWLKDNAVKHQQAKNISEHFQKHLLEELNLALENKCEQLAEAYSYMGKVGLKKYVVFVESIINDAQKWADVAKQISINNRAPRVKKPKSPLKQVEKLKYLKEHETLKSIPPTQIVGATQLWVYNVKYKTLGVYICNNAHGFSVKGCTILNYETADSICKKLRKPNEIIPKVLEAGKVALKKIIPNIRAKEKKLTGRINKDTILLKAL